MTVPRFVLSIVIPPLGFNVNKLDKSKLFPIVIGVALVDPAVAPIFKVQLPEPALFPRFTLVKKNFEASDFYTLSDALVYRQSASTWNLIPERVMADVLLELEDYYKKSMVRGLVERKLSVQCVVGRAG